MINQQPQTPELHEKDSGSTKPQQFDEKPLISNQAPFIDTMLPAPSDLDGAKKEKREDITPTHRLTPVNFVEPNATNNFVTPEEEIKQNYLSIDKTRDNTSESIPPLRSSQTQLDQLTMGRPLNPTTGGNTVPVANSRANHVFTTGAFPLQSPSFAFVPNRNIPLFDPLSAMPSTQPLLSYGTTRTAYPATTFVTRTPSQSLSIAAQQTQLIKAIGGMTNQGEEVGSIDVDDMKLLHYATAGYLNSLIQMKSGGSKPPNDIQSASTDHLNQTSAHENNQAQILKGKTRKIVNAMNGQVVEIDEATGQTIIDENNPRISIPLAKM